MLKTPMPYSPSKQPISTSLTSLHRDKEPFEGTLESPSAGRVHHLPPSIWKQKTGAPNSPLDRAIDKTRNFFFREQLPQGYWWAELESNATITSEYIMLLHFMGIVDKARERKMAQYLLSRQTEEGYWTLWFNGPGDLSTTVEAYFALKLAGYDQNHPALLKAREFILSRGGILKTRVFTKIFLALFGEFSWLGVPSMPIELMLLPQWAYFNMYELSSWSRATIIPLSITMTMRPVRKLPPASRVQELYPRPPRTVDYSFTREEGIFSWKNCFIGLDHILKIYESTPLRPLKSKGMAAAEKWVLEHQESTGDWGGIQPAMLNSVLALHCLGYANNHPAVEKGLKALDNFTIEGENTLVLQSCISPLWDTALALKSLLDSGTPLDHPALVNAAQWLLKREIRKDGDWKVKSPELKPGGWAFEFQNDWYPDVDDSGFVMIAIRDIAVRDEKAKQDAISRGFDWCMGMQSKNGGWGAFDRDNTKHLLNKIPFADLEALIDPPTADLTGRMLELMGSLGHNSSHPRAARAIKFIKEEQEKNGSWWGRWGVNHIYGTWSVLSGLSAIGEDCSQPYIRNAVVWLKSKQNSDGGWGECCESYYNPELAGIGPSTASQTAWALLALMSAGEAESSETIRGVNYLLSTQKDDGTWDEDQFTGTGFPKYFMIKYHIYRNCFPLSALGVYRRLTPEGVFGKRAS